MRIFNDTQTRGKRFFMPPAGARNGEEKKERLSPGLTLIEVMISLVILMFGLLAMASMQIMAIRGNSHAYTTTQRTTAAAYYMEWLSGLDFDHNNLRDLSPGSTAFDHPSTGNADPADDDTVLENLEGITGYSWRVENVGDDEDGSGTIEADEAAAKRITVKVIWADNGETTLTNKKYNPFGI